MIRLSAFVLHCFLFLLHFISFLLSKWLRRLALLNIILSLKEIIVNLVHFFKCLLMTCNSFYYVTVKTYFNSDPLSNSGQRTRSQIFAVLGAKDDQMFIPIRSNHSHSLFYTIRITLEATTFTQQPHSFLYSFTIHTLYVICFCVIKISTTV